jgi:hypothetical protein
MPIPFNRANPPRVDRTGQRDGNLSSQAVKFTEFLGAGVACVSAARDCRHYGIWGDYPLFGKRR